LARTRHLRRLGRRFPVHAHRRRIVGGSGIASLEETITEAFVPGVVEMALNAVQDDVAHATHGIAWPSDPETTQPLPQRWATVEDGLLSFGYGSRTFATDIRLVDLAT
jgi:hypothetical protein